MNIVRDSVGGYYSARPHSSTLERLTRDAKAPWNSTKWRIGVPLGGQMPQFSSVRVQKAYRLNEIEAIRLRRRVQILDSQHLRADRLVNQDIRLTRGALEHIEASTGSLRPIVVAAAVGAAAAAASSSDGAWTAAAAAAAPKDDDADESGSSASSGGRDYEAALSVKPMFLYGERQVSRKVNRYRSSRTQSAAAAFVAAADWRRRKDSVVVVAAAAEKTPRPKTASAAAAPSLFRAIEERVQRKISENPDYDPNADSPALVSFPGV